MRQHRPRQSNKVQKGIKKKKSKKGDKARREEKKGHKGRNNSRKKKCINKRGFVAAIREGNTKKEKKKITKKSLLKVFK